jgi:hypothetical protein
MFDPGCADSIPLRIKTTNRGYYLKLARYTVDSQKQRKLSTDLDCTSIIITKVLQVNHIAQARSSRVGLSIGESIFQSLIFRDRDIY